MRVGIRLRVLVVYAVITHPIEQTVLPRKTVAAHQDDAQRQLGLIGSMCPQPVGTTRDTESGTATDENTPYPCR
uniref:Putative secreted protein n=1 Tax=Anopheles darlingi TaxID=43151 RepID=A0A2M4D618_ANODA